MRKWLTFTVLLLCVSLAFGACAAKKAATPEDQVLLDSSATLTQLAASFVDTSTGYTAKCNATPRALPAADCNAFIRFSDSFKGNYQVLTDDWTRARTTKDSALSQAVATRAAALKAQLQPYADKAK